MANDSTQRDIVLDIGTYAYIRDRTGGAIKIGTGPNTITPSQSDEPVRFDAKTGRFMPCSLDQAVLLNVIAKEGSYIVLENPAQDNKQPRPEMKGVKADVALNIGSKLVIPGPWDFPLWPRQSAEVIDGHHLRSNQYLLVRVYNEKLAKENWNTAIMRPASITPPGPDATEEEKKAYEEKKAAAPQEQPKQVVPADLTTGKLHIIKGTEVSFFIPPSGIEVVKDEKGNYVREALTLERMEYSILVDENGNKRYERGPQVVFPSPTERFARTKNKDGGEGDIKQSAIELNALQGLHIKALVDCDVDGTKFQAGEEYFVTGAGTYDSEDNKVGEGVTIYYPREELAFVRYDGKTKIFAVTVPEGEGRYVMNRVTGEIKTVVGPAQLLPNPCKYVIVRRVLSVKQCATWYPGNQEALDYNLAIAGAAAASPTTRAGALSEGDFERAATKSAGPQRGRERQLLGGGDVMRSASVMMAATNYAGETSRVSGEQKVMGDEFERSSGYTSPRTLTLNTKYQGAVLVEVWVGYAILVVSKSGDRRVVQGPQTVLLDYDEALEVLAFSTGKPKTTDNLFSTAYLQVANNKVSDVISVETIEGVKAQVYVSYMVGFEGDPSKWFEVNNYVKLLCDRGRSILKGTIRKLGVREFVTSSTDIVRDTLLGKHTEDGRPGLGFEENGMRARDIDVLDVQLLNPQLAGKIAQAQLSVIDANLNLDAKKREVEIQEQIEQLNRKQAEYRAESEKRSNELMIELSTSKTAAALSTIADSLKELAEQRKELEAQQELENFQIQSETERKTLVASAELALKKKELDQTLTELSAQTESIIKRFESAKGGLTEALVAVADKEVLTKLGQALNIQQIIGGESVSDAVAKIFAGSPVESMVKRMLAGTAAIGGNGKTETPATPKA